MSELIAPALQAAIRGLARSALELLLPLHCLGCRKEGDVLCDRSIDGFRRLEPPFCDTCAEPDVSGQCQWCPEHPPRIYGFSAPFLFDHQRDYYEPVNSD